MYRRQLLASLAAASVGTQIATPRVANAASPKTRRPARPFIETRDGTRLFYRDWGQGKPLVFVAPWALCSDYWEYQMTPLSEQGVRCVGYDRRGHGRSDEPSHGYDFDTLADDLATLIDELNLRDVTLIGHSMGAGEVVRYLGKHGASRIARVVLLAPITPMTLKTEDHPEGVPQAALDKGRASFSADRPKAIADAAPAFFGPKNNVSQQVMDWWTRQILQVSLKVMSDLYRAMTQTDFRPDLRAITSPTLIINGDNDTSTPLDVNARRTAALIRGSELRVYEGAAHGLAVTHQNRLNKDLLAYATT